MLRRNKKDKTLRELAAFYEKKKYVLKYLTMQPYNQKNAKEFISIHLFDLPQRASFSIIKNRCVISGRSRSVYRAFKLSRMKLKEFSKAAYLPGLSKRKIQ